jgi:hypothetical protein
MKPGDQQGKPGDEKTMKPGDQQGKPGDEKAMKPGEQQGKPGDQQGKPGDQQGKPGDQQGKPGDSQQPGEGSEGKPGEGSDGPPGEKPGDAKKPGGSNSPNSGGGGRDGGSSSPIVEEKNKKPLDTPKDEPKNPGDDVAPKDGGPPLVIQEIQDLLRAGKSTKDLEAETGMTRQEMQDLVKKFEKVEKPAAEPSRDLKGDLGKDKTIDKNRKFIDPIKANTVSGRAGRGPGTVAGDTLAGDAEGARSVAPPEYKSRWEAYRSSLAKTEKGAAPKPSSPPR